MRQRKHLLIITAFLSIFFTQMHAQINIYVGASVNDEEGGISWNSAYRRLEQALTLAEKDRATVERKWDDAERFLTYTLPGSSTQMMLK